MGMRSTTPPGESSKEISRPPFAATLDVTFCIVEAAGTGLWPTSPSVFGAVGRQPMHNVKTAPKAAHGRLRGILIVVRKSDATP
jgi:hypothetical protein